MRWIVMVTLLVRREVSVTSASCREPCGWPLLCEQAFQLTTPWTFDLWTAWPTLVALNFEWWLYLFVESARTKLKGADYLALLMMEESYKHIAAVEVMHGTTPQDDLVISFIEGVADLVTYYPQALHSLGKKEAGLNGSFTPTHCKHSSIKSISNCLLKTQDRSVDLFRHSWAVALLLLYIYMFIYVD